MIKISKFGGTSLADASCIRRVAEIIKDDKDRKFVVVSAPGIRWDGDRKITDLLYCCAENRGNFETVFSEIAARFTRICADLKIKLDLESEMKLIARNIDNGAKTDYIVSRGEYLTAKILAKFLGYEFVDASELIRFKGEILATSITKTMIRRRLKDSEYVVIPGFYGAREDGSIKAFSRGGSDYSGAIIAEGMKADIYENWTDVEGFRATDPKIIKYAKKVEFLTYDEMYRLASMGATVLHPSTVNPLRADGIKLVIKNTFSPSGSGTLIAESAEGRREELAGIAVKKLSLEELQLGTGQQASELNGRGRAEEEDSCTFLTLVGYKGDDLLARVSPIIEKTAEINYISHVSGGDLIIGITNESNVFLTLTALYNEFFKN